MKKKLFITLLSLVCAICCLFGLAACNGGKDNNNPNGEDKASQNAEFVEFRKKVITVLKDNGVSVNDVEVAEKESKMIKRLSSRIITASYTEHTNEINDIIMNANPTQNLETVKDNRDDIFGQTFYLSLIVGDAVSNYYNEKSLYGIDVSFDVWNGQCFEIVKNGSNDLIRCYTPEDDSVLTMELNYISANEYSYTCIQIWDGASVYCYGNSQKEFLTVFRDFNGDKWFGNCVHYAPDDNSGYICDDFTAVDNAYSLVKDMVDAMDQSAVRAIKDKVKYRITKEQSETVFEKYFGNNGGYAEQEDGVFYTQINGRNVAVGYMATNGQSEVVIPSDIETIQSPFKIEDSKGTVKSLFIPKSINTIVDEAGNDISDLSEFRLQFNEDYFDNITVEQGSTIFKSGSGSLYTIDGVLIYLVDSPLESFDLSFLDNEDIRSLIKSGSYTKIFNKITALDVNLTDIDEIIYAILNERILPEMKALTTLDLTGDFTQGIHIEPLNITVNKPLTVNCDFVCDWKQSDGNRLPAFTFTVGSDKTATVNLKGMSRIESIYSDEVDVTVNLDFPQALYTAQEIDILQGSQNVRFVYSEKIISSMQASIFRFEEHNKSGVPEMKVALGRWHDLVPSGVTEITVPEFFQYDITAVEIRESDIQTVILTPKIKYLLFEEIIENKNITFKYSGTLEEFENNIQIICYADNYSFTLNYDGGSKVFSGNQSIPSDDICTVTLKVLDNNGQFITKTISAVKDRTFNYYWDIDIDSNIEDGEYLALSNKNFVVEAAITRMWVNDIPGQGYYCHRLSISCDKKLNGDTIFTLVQGSIYESANIMISENGFECQVYIQWDCGMDILASTYEGKSLWATQSPHIDFPNKFDFIFQDSSGLLIKVVFDYEIIIVNSKLSLKISNFNIESI